MCWMCHQNMSDEVVRQQLRSSLENPRYEVWNSTSLSHLMISLMGANGYEASELAYKLYEGFISWVRETQNTLESLEESLKPMKMIRDGVQECKAKGMTEEQLKGEIHKSMNHK